MDEPAEAEADPDVLLAELGERLAGEVERALPGWVEREVVRLHDAWAGSTSTEVRARAAEAGRQAAAEIGPPLRALLTADVDAQRGNPLAAVRAAVRFPTAVLAEAGVGEVVRDEHAERLFPDDVYDLTPGGFADLDPDLGPLGLAWGAAKAMAHKRRHSSPFPGHGGPRSR